MVWDDLKALPFEVWLNEGEIVAAICLTKWEYSEVDQNWRLLKSHKTESFPQFLSKMFGARNVDPR